MRQNLSWLRGAREEWRIACDDAVMEANHVMADLCQRQVDAFDHLIRRAEEFLAKRE
jgi:hypothetical protein